MPFPWKPDMNSPSPRTVEEDNNPSHCLCDIVQWPHVQNVELEGLVHPLGVEETNTRVPTSIGLLSNNYNKVLHFVILSD